MRPELDTAGAAAPPRLNGELAFDEPWQGRLFATTMAACDAGLVDYDTFRDRITIPITDERGRILAFGARLMTGDGPKYLNAPETPLYRMRIFAPDKVPAR